jgi:rare lipoprotein A (peptidoglycan hydrolase)
VQLLFSSSIRRARTVVLPWRPGALAVIALLGFQACGIIAGAPERKLSPSVVSRSQEPAGSSTEKPETQNLAPKTPAIAKIPPPSEASPTPLVAKIPSASRPNYVETGLASWYGPGFHGKVTASGEIFNQDKLTAAHRTLPWGSRVKVTNLANGKSVIVQINDRGPAVKSRIIDVSRAAARALGMVGAGTTPVQVEWLAGPEKLGELVSDGR